MMAKSLKLTKSSLVGNLVLFIYVKIFLCCLSGAHYSIITCLISIMVNRLKLLEILALHYLEVSPSFASILDPPLGTCSGT